MCEAGLLQASNTVSFAADSAKQTENYLGLSQQVRQRSRWRVVANRQYIHPYRSYRGASRLP